jgi:hypothetical protein
MLLESVGLESVAPLKPNGGGSLGWIARPVATGNAAATDDAAATNDTAAPDDTTAPDNAPATGDVLTDASLEGQNYVELGALAAAYQQSFGRVAKVWGNPAKPLFTVAVCSGGAGEVVPEVVKAGVDCFVTGELRHHEALYLADENIALIELGHDISELPYRLVLRDTLVEAGFPAGDLIVLEPSAAWWQLEPLSASPQPRNEERK